MKKSLILAGMLAVGYANSQTGNVGINTENPKATLEVLPNVKNAEATATTNEGIVAPKLTKARIANIAEANLVEGTLVYATDATYTGNNTKVAKITEKGYYFYDGTEWVKAGADITDQLWAQRNNNGVTETYLKPADANSDKYLYSEKGALLNLGGVTREETRWVRDGNYGWAEGEVPNMVMINSDKLPLNSNIGNDAANGAGTEFYFNKNFSLLKETHASAGNKAGSKNYVGNVMRLSSLDVTSKINSITGTAIGADAYSGATITNLKGLGVMTVAGSDTQGATVTHNIAGEFTARNFPTSTSTNLIGINALTQNYGTASNIMGGRFRASSSNNYASLGVTNPAQTLQDLRGIHAIIDNNANSTTAYARALHTTSNFNSGSMATEGYGIDVRSYLLNDTQVDMLSNVNSYIRANYGANTVKDVYAFRFHHILNADFKPTNMYGLYLADVKNATEKNFSIYTNAGKVRLGDLKGTGNRIVTVDADGVLSTSDATTIAAQNIYNTDGTLTDNRIVNLDNKKLTFDGEGKVRVGSIENENSTAKFGVITELDLDYTRNTLFFAPNLSEGNSTHIAIGKNFDRNNAGSIDFVYRGDRSNTNGIGFKTTNRSNGTNPNFILFAQADGNVGINNNNPTQKLDVVGNGQFSNPEGSVHIRLNPSGETSYAYFKLMREGVTRWDFGMDGTAETGANDGSDYYISSALDDGTTYTRRFTIKRESGNVGIGIQHPTEKLEVNGNAKITGLRGTGNRVVYADKDGVLKTGSSADAEAGKVASTTGMQCNAENRGKMNFIQGADGKSDVFGICMKNADGKYYWGYMVGGNNPTNGEGAFGSGL